MSCVSAPQRAARALALLFALCAAMLAVALAAPAQAPAGVMSPPDSQRAHLRGGPQGKAVAPKGAPSEVRKLIRAGNKIRDKRYKWGGGHGSWKDKGYDCSGSVSYVLHKAGLLDYPMVSGSFSGWGAKGVGKWVTVFSSKDHVFLVVAGLRFDTSYITDGDKSGPGWSETQRPVRGFKKTHPVGDRAW